MAQSDENPLYGLFDGTFYEIIETFPNGKVSAKCKLCPISRPTVISGQKKISSNFLTHLKRRHKDQWERRQTSKKSKKDSSNESPSMLNFVTKGNQPKKPCTQNEAKKSITSFVVNCGLPVTTVEKKEFKDLVEKLSSGNCHSITTKTLYKSITDDFSEMMTKIKTELKNAKFVCTTADIWSNKKRSFLGMTAHFIADDLNRKSYAIACERFEGKIISFHRKFSKH